MDSLRALFVSYRERNDTMDNVISRAEKTRLVLDEFCALAAIPHPSAAEQAVGDHLEQSLRKAGLTVYRDTCGNLIAEKQASAGCEAWPTTILQAHMDMVCVSADGVAYDKYTDPIRLVEDGDYLKADGTSLGADDGIGVAVIMVILKDQTLVHGPIRAIFTVEEETSMRGASQLDAKWLDGDYLINCDSEEVDVITVSSAGGMHIDARLICERADRREETTVCQIEVGGLLGGHSGVDIHKGRANAILVMADILAQLDGVRLIRFDGGMARNAIPARVRALVEMPVRKISEAEHFLQAETARLRNAYPAESGLTITLRETKCDELPMTDDAMARLISFCRQLPNGVRSMHQAIPSLVESSSNVGVAETSGDIVEFRLHPRSSNESDMAWYRKAVGDIAKSCKMEADFYGEIPAWPLISDNRLAQLASAVYEKQNGSPMKIEACHAGLECSYFYRKNPNLKLISIGPTVEHVHSPQERIVIDTIAVHLDLIIGILAEMGAR